LKWIRRCINSRAKKDNYKLINSLYGDQLGAAKAQKRFGINHRGDFEQFRAYFVFLRFQKIHKNSQKKFENRFLNSIKPK